MGRPLASFKRLKFKGHNFPLRPSSICEDWTNTQDIKVQWGKYVQILVLGTQEEKLLLRLSRATEASNIKTLFKFQLVREVRVICVGLQGIKVHWYNLLPP